MAQSPTATQNKPASHAAAPGGACCPGEVEQDRGRPAVVDSSPLSPNVSKSLMPEAMIEGLEGGYHFKSTVR